MAEMNFPITVKAIKWDGSEPLNPKLLLGGKQGDLVAVRPCGEEYEGKTFLGVLLGELALGRSCNFDQKTGELTIHRSFYNPMIFIPDRGALVFGAESWWGKIESEEHLRTITDADISNQWYVKALKQLAEKEETCPKN